MVSNAIEKSQRRVESHNFEIRKQLLDFDNVMNQQREVVYSLRRDLMSAESTESIAFEYADDLLEEILQPALDAKELDDEDKEAVLKRVDEVFNFSRFEEFGKDELPSMEQADEWVKEVLSQLKSSAPDHYEEILRYFLLDALDRNWKEHLLNMDHLRDGIGLRGYGQKDPKQEYKREGFNLFQEMLYTIKENTMRAFSHLRIQAEVKEEEFQHDTGDDLEYSGAGDEEKKPVRRKEPKVGRNEPCPCGSGRKYKKCCGR
nr:SEC-C metal-binding domain-containing protein [Salidesulfovibrio brasiliensis]